jgi:MinD superfamily P-loop ATPase
LAIINQAVRNLSKHEVKRILYFETPGSHNTDHVVEAVNERAAEGDIRHVIVASISGRTALKVAEKLQDTDVSVVCVSGCPSWLVMSGRAVSICSRQIERES